MHDVTIGIQVVEVAACNTTMILEQTLGQIHLGQWDSGSLSDKATHELGVEIHHNLEVTHNPIPEHTKTIPSQVSRLMTLPSTYHSPNTVKRNARELVMGIVSDSSINGHVSKMGLFEQSKKWTLEQRTREESSSPAFPTNRKNQIEPVKLQSSGTAYRGLFSNPMTVKKAFATCRASQLRWGSVMDGWFGGE